MQMMISFTIILLFPFILLADFTIEQKVGQLLMVHFYGPEANEDARKLIEEVFVGGFIYYNWSNELSNPEQIRALSESLQQLSPIPLFIAIDQEGGKVQRLKNGFPIFPSNSEIVSTEMPFEAEECALAIGISLKNVGINMNLAPVVDICDEHTIIGKRSFGNNPEVVVEFAQNAIEGYKKAGIIYVLKHFPGHGDAEVDSHYGLPIVYKTWEELESRELVPYFKLAAQAPLIMTAHILLPSIDASYCATLSSFILEDILRKKIQYEGIIISDSLVMKGVLENRNIADVALQAFLAGCDILLLGGRQLDLEGDVELTIDDIIRVHHTLVEAVKSGLITMDRLDASIERIFKCKNRWDIGKRHVHEPDNTLEQNK